MKRRELRIDARDFAWGFFILTIIGMYIAIGLMGVPAWLKIFFWSSWSAIVGISLDTY